MAQEEIGLKLGIDAAGANKSLKELKAEVKALSNELAATSRGSQAYTDLAKKVAHAKDQIEDLHKDINAFKPNGEGLANTFGNIGRGIIGGFAAAQGVFALMGGESEKLQQTLLKVQASMALLEGFKGIQEGVKSFGQMRLVIGDVIKSLSAMQKAVIATGIGAFAVALGLVVSYWDDIKETISGVSAEQKALNKEAHDHTVLANESLKALEGQENQLKLAGKSEREILTLKQKATETAINTTEVELERQKNTLQFQIDAEKRNKDIAMGIINFMTIPIRALTWQFNKMAELVGSDFRIGDIGETLSEMIFSPSDVEKKGLETQKELDKQIEALKEKRAGFQLAIQKIDNDSYKKGQDDKRKADEEQAKLDKEWDEIVKEQRKKDNLEYAEQVKEEVDAEAAYQKMVKEQIKKDNLEYAQTSLEQDKLIAEAKLSIYKSTFASLNTLAEIAVNDQKKLGAIQKVLALVQMGVDTALAISSAGRAAAAATANAGGNPIAGIAVYVSTVAMVLANLARAKAMLSSAGSGGGGGVPSSGGGTGTGAPVVNNPTVGTTTLATNQQGQYTGMNQGMTVKAYVVESELTGTQKKVNSISKKAFFE